MFIINLHDKLERWKEVIKSFIRYNIKFNRYEAVDGRYKTKTEGIILKKKLEKKYNIKIHKNIDTTAASLVIGTIDILRYMLKNNLDTILICEDDVYLIPSVINKFKESIKHLTEDWDLLYLGCGNHCGCNGISKFKTSNIKYKTSYNEIYEDLNFYVKYKDDLRMIDEDDCDYISKNLSYAKNPGGTWCYAFSKNGAKKFLSHVNIVNDHIDQIIIKLVKKGLLKAIAFDPPIAYHMGGAKRVDSSIKWDW